MLSTGRIESTGIASTSREHRHPLAASDPVHDLHSHRWQGVHIVDQTITNEPGTPRRPRRRSLRRRPDAGHRAAGGSCHRSTRPRSAQEHTRRHEQRQPRTPRRRTRPESPQERARACLDRPSGADEPRPRRLHQEAADVVPEHWLTVDPHDTGTGFGADRDRLRGVERPSSVASGGTATTGHPAAGAAAGLTTTGTRAAGAATGTGCAATERTDSAAAANSPDGGRAQRGWHP